MCGLDAIAFGQFVVFMLHNCDTFGVADVHVKGMTPFQTRGLAKKKRCERRRKIHGKKQGPIWSGPWSISYSVNAVLFHFSEKGGVIDSESFARPPFVSLRAFVHPLDNPFLRDLPDHFSDFRQ